MTKIVIWSSGLQLGFPFSRHILKRPYIAFVEESRSLFARKGYWLLFVLRGSDELLDDGNVPVIFIGIISDAYSP